MAESRSACDGEEYFELLNRYFVQDPAIDELDFLFCPKCQEEQAKDAMILQEHKLGLKIWCVKPLYMYTYNKLLRQQRQGGSRQESCTESLTATNVIQLSRAVVLLSAECYTAWNIRKELVSSGLLSVENDLQLSTLVLTKHPRSAETFAHRKWLITYYVKQKGKSQYCQDWLRKELSICLHCAERYPDNYVVWSHRGWVSEKFLDSKKKLLSELQCMELWVEKHISDHCGFHHRQDIINKLKLLLSCCDLALLCLAELQFVSSLLDTFPGHEAIWYHRRYVFYHWKEWFGEMTVDNLHDFALLLQDGKKLTGNTSFFQINRASCWGPCVRSLRYLCRSAMVKMRPVECKALDDVAVPDWLPSIESEAKYCHGILRRKHVRVDEAQQRLATNYLKWLSTAFTGTELNGRVVHREPFTGKQLQAMSSS